MQWVVKDGLDKRSATAIVLGIAHLFLTAMLLTMLILLLRSTGVTAAEWAEIPPVFLFSVRNRPLHMLVTACELVSGFVYLYDLEMARVDDSWLCSLGVLHPIEHEYRRHGGDGAKSAGGRMKLDRTRN